MRRRHGFSLVELLVAMALVIFIMTIISEAFVAGLESVRLLKAQSDMQANLRVAATALRSDLTDPHFIGYGPKLSDQNLSINPPGSWGYFRIMQGMPAPLPFSPPPYGDTYFNESPLDPLPSFGAVDHVMAFSRQDATTGLWYEVSYFVQPNGANAGLTPLYALYRHEVGPFPTPAGNPQPFLDLSQPYNRYGMVPCNWAGPASSIPNEPNPIVGSPAVVLVPAGGGNNVNTMPSWQQVALGQPPPNVVNWTIAADATWQNMPPYYIGAPYGVWGLGGGTPLPAGFPAPGTMPPPLAGTINPVGNDILLTNVISFEIRIYSPQIPAPPAPQTPWTQFVNLFDAITVQSQNHQPLNAQFWQPPGGGPLLPPYPAVFDTWFQQSKLTAAQIATATAIDPSILNVPLQIQIKAIQIIIRVWDERTQQTRQITIIQDM
jgi:prepilin-type N-terminal cleavage/methylation domain-containing protein